MRFNYFDEQADASFTSFANLITTRHSGGGAAYTTYTYTTDTTNTSTWSSFAPRLIPGASSPQDGATSGVSTTPLITLQFDQTMLIGNGTIFITDGAVQTVIDRATGKPVPRIVGATHTSAIEVDSGAVTITGNTVEIQVSNMLLPQHEYSVYFGSGVLRGTNGISYAGMADTTVLNFTTGAASIPPQALSARTTSAAGIYGIGDQINIEVTFSETVVVSGAPALQMNAGAGTATYLSGSNSNTLLFGYTVAAGDSAFELDFAGATLPAGGAVADLDGNVLDGANVLFSHLGAAVPDGYGTHSGIVVDAVAPLVATWSVAAGATGVDSAAGVTLTFSEAVDIASGNVLLIDYLASDGIEERSLTHPGVIWDGHSNLTLTDLPAGAELAIAFGIGAITDDAGNALASSTSRSFTTAVDTVKPILANMPSAPVTTSSFTLLMSEAVRAASGNLVFTDTVGGAVTAVPVANLSFVGRDVIVPTASLQAGHSYQLKIEAGAMKDYSENLNIEMIGTVNITFAPTF